MNDHKEKLPSREEQFDKMSSFINKVKVSIEIAKKVKILPALHTNIGVTWYQQLKPEFDMPYFANLSKFLEERRRSCTVYPPPEHVWTWTQLPFHDVKVVILGQDPYHGPRQAHGLCFSVSTGVPVPPSLKNIFQELTNNFPDFQVPNHGNLIGWLRQGVLLLNATLTVEANKPMSHYKKGWENLTAAVIMQINRNLKGVVFLLWGASAQQQTKLINKKKHMVLTARHPSPMSAYKGFLGCRHFSLCNNYLTQNGKTPIDWNHLPEK